MLQLSLLLMLLSQTMFARLFQQFQLFHLGLNPVPLRSTMLFSKNRHWVVLRGVKIPLENASRHRDGEAQTRVPTCK